MAQHTYKVNLTEEQKDFIDWVINGDNFPLYFLAYNQLYRAVLTPPMWSHPVGLGANLVFTLIRSS